MNKKRKITILFSGVLIFGILIYGIGMSRGKITKFDFSVALNLYAEFIGNMTVMLVGFYLVNIFWFKQQEDEKTKDFLTNQIMYLRSLDYRVKASWRLINNPQDDKIKVLERDRIFLEKWETVKTMAQNEYMNGKREIKSRVSLEYQASLDKIKVDVEKISNLLITGNVRSQSVMIIESLHILASDIQETINSITKILEELENEKSQSFK